MGLDLMLDVAPGMFGGDGLYYTQSGLTITPAVGAERLANGVAPITFTGDDPDGWVVSGEITTDPAVKQVAANEDHTGVGTGAVCLYNSATAFQPYMKQTNALVVGEWYRAELVVSKATLGTIAASDDANRFRKFCSTAQTHVWTGQATNTKFDIGGNTAGCDITISSASVKPITNFDVPFTHLYPYGDFSVTFTEAAGVYQTGVFFNKVDDSNLMRLYYDRTDGKIYLTQRVAGVVTQLGAWTATYVANKTLIARRYPDGSMDILYNGVLIGSAAASGLTGLQAGPFATNASVTMGYSWDARWCIPLVDDTFSDAAAPFVTDGLVAGLGASGLTWVGSAGLANTGGHALVVPTPGADLFDAGKGTFDSGIGAWIAVGTNAVTNDAGQLSIAYVDNVNGANSPFSAAGDLASNLTVGIFYRFQTSARVLAGNLVVLNFSDGAAAHSWKTVSETTLTPNQVTFLARGAATGFQQAISMAAGEIIWLDDQTLKPLVFADCLRAVSNAGATNPRLSAKWTITANTQAGVVINLDSAAAPQNCIHVWVDRLESKVYAREMVAGTWSADKFTPVAVTYGATKRLTVERIGNLVYVLYDGVVIGSWTTAVPTTGTLMALWQTDGASFAQDVIGYTTVRS